MDKHQKNAAKDALLKGLPLPKIYQVVFTDDSKPIEIGQYDTLEAARIAATRKCEQYFGKGLYASFSTSDEEYVGSEDIMAHSVGGWVDGVFYADRGLAVTFAINCLPLERIAVTKPPYDSGKAELMAANNN